MKFKFSNQEFKKELLIYLGSVILCLGIGFVAGITTANSISSWYQTLAKPPLNPPNWIFSPVWTILYVAMGVSLARAYINQAKLSFFWIQLLLNFMWSIIFFGWKNPDLALIDIILLGISILLTIKSFRQHDRWAAHLLWPYLGWVLFATYLNIGIVWLN